MNKDRPKPIHTGILNADVVGYSRLMETDKGRNIKSLEETKLWLAN